MLRTFWLWSLMFLLVAACGPDAAESPKEDPVAAVKVVTGQIEVTGPNGPLADRATHFVGGRDVGVPFPTTFTIKNVGVHPLVVDRRSFSRETNCRGKVATEPKVLAPGETITAIAEVTPEAEGAFYCTLLISNDDPDSFEKDFEIIIQGTGHAVPKPVVRVAGSSGEIKKGATDPVGTQPVGVAFTQAYTIGNVGASPLTIGAISFPTPTRCKVTAPTFTPMMLPASTGTMPLVLSVTPTAPGDFTCPVSFINDDNSKNPFDFTITGTTPPGPNIRVVAVEKQIKQASTDLVGDHPAGADFEVAYDIFNDGTADLTISDFSIPFGALTNCSVAIIIPPAPTVGVGTPLGGGITSFRLSIHPDNPGPFSLSVQIESNDADEGHPFGFAIAGTAVAAPVIKLAIANNGIDLVGSKTFGVPASLAYTITNAGTANLTVGPITLEPVTNCTGSVTTNPAGQVVAPAGSTSLGISVTPTAVGPFKFNFRIASSDVVTSSYTVSISGTGAVANPCALANASKVVGGKNIYRVPMNKGCSGDQICAAAGKTCAGVPVLGSAACVAFHPGTQVKSDYNGWKQSVYCDGTAGGLACNGETQCHDCPLCNATGLVCNDPNSSLLTELYVECL